MERLRDLKRIYDPEDRFRSNAPIGVAKAQQERDEF